MFYENDWRCSLKILPVAALGWIEWGQGSRCDRLDHREQNHGLSFGFCGQGLEAKTACDVAHIYICRRHLGSGIGRVAGGVDVLITISSFASAGKARNRELGEEKKKASGCMKQRVERAPSLSLGQQLLDY